MTRRPRMYEHARRDLLEDTRARLTDLRVEYRARRKAEREAEQQPIEDLDDMLEEAFQEGAIDALQYANSVMEEEGLDIEFKSQYELDKPILH